MRNRALLILFTTLIFLLSINLVSAFPINLTNNISINSVFPINSTTLRGTVSFNFTIINALASRSNVTNVTFAINNSATGAVTSLGTNTTANLTFYSIRYDTTTLTNGNYTLSFNITNTTTGGMGVTEQVLNFTKIGNWHNFSIDNTALTISVATISNQTNGTYGPDSNVINVTITDPIPASVRNCTLIINGTVVNNSISPNGTLTGWNYSSTPVLNLSHGFFTANLTCDETALNVLDFTIRSSTVNSNQFIVDFIAPFFKLKFTDTDGNEQDEFGFGESVKVDCDPGDRGVGITAMTINVSIRRPGIATFFNITGVTGSGNPTENVGEVTIPGSETQELGDYIIQCFIQDALGVTNRSHENRTNRTFTIKVSAPLSTSAFGIPGFKKPIADKIIGVGVINNIGEISETGEARLIGEKGGVIITIDGMEHTVTVDSINDEAATLLVDGSEAPFNSGDMKQFDLNSDNTNELEITLNMIYHKKADLIFKKIAVQAAPPTQPPAEPPTTQPPAEVEKKKSNIIISGLIILIVVVIILLILHFVRKRGSGDGNVRFRPKDLGAGREEFYITPPQNKTQSSGAPPFAL